MCTPIILNKNVVKAKEREKKRCKRSHIPGYICEGVLLFPFPRHKLTFMHFEPTCNVCFLLNSLFSALCINKKLFKNKFKI